MTTIYVYPTGDGADSVKLTPLPMAGLLIAAWNLLDQACDLAQPEYIGIDNAQAIDLQFTGQLSSMTAITRWAMRFGAVPTSEPHQTGYGPQIWVYAHFDYYGVHVKAYAHIPAAPATT